MTDAPLLATDDGSVRILTLHRPAKKNAFDIALATALWEAIEAADRDDSVRAIVVTGGDGDMFTAGVDMGIFLAIGAGQSGDLVKVATLHHPIRACKKPIVAAVNGMAVGMGVTLLPHFDMVYAAEEATFLTPFVRLGLVVEFGGSWALPRQIGRQRASELLLRPHPIDSGTALSWGLVNRTFPRAELMASVLEIVRDIAAAPPGAVADCKRLLRAGEETATLDEAFQRETEVLATRYGSPENIAAVQAFLESRRKKG